MTWLSPEGVSVVRGAGCRGAVTGGRGEGQEEGGKNSDSSTGETSCSWPCCWPAPCWSLPRMLAPMAAVSSTGEEATSRGPGLPEGEGVEMLDICFFNRQNLVILLS